MFIAMRTSSKRHSAAQLLNDKCRTIPLRDVLGFNTVGLVFRHRIGKLAMLILLLG